MCVAVFVKPGHRLNEKQLLDMYDSNRDGFGFGGVAIPHPTVAATAAPVMSRITGLLRDRVVSEYERFLGTIRPESPHIAHFRIATMGEVSSLNCHPFFISNGLLIHNGMLSYGSTSAKKSDTNWFASQLYSNLNADAVLNNSAEFDKLVGFNKIVMMWNDGRYHIANERMGSWIDDGAVWVSNSGFRYNKVA